MHDCVCVCVCVCMCVESVDRTMGTTIFRNIGFSSSHNNAIMCIHTDNKAVQYAGDATSDKRFTRSNVSLIFI